MTSFAQICHVIYMFLKKLYFDNILVEVFDSSLYRGRCCVLCSSIYGEVGRQLALIADDITERYSTQFSRMTRRIHPAPPTTHQVFARAARK